MKKTILLLIALLGIIGFGYSQSLENMGDEAFLQGKYAQAEDYYKRANNLDPSNKLKDKISKSRTLKDEFEIIDRAIASNEFEKAKVHIDNVLRIDPGNLWANERKNKLSNKKSKERFKGFDGEYYPRLAHDGLLFSGGIRFDIRDEMLCPIIKISYFNYKNFPFTIDYSCQLYNYAYDHGTLFHGIGWGSAYFLSNRWTIDYGLGLMVSSEKYLVSYEDPTDPYDWEIVMKKKPYLGLYIRAGISFEQFISYYWNHGFAKDYPYAPINAHYLVITLPIPFN